MASSILSVLVGLLMKLIGQEFVAKVLLIGFKAWSSSTANKWDDQICEAFAKAWGVSPQALKDLPEVK